MQTIRPAAAADIPAVAGLLARAFAEDPVTEFLFPRPERRSDQLRRFFTLQLRHTYLPRGEVLVSEDLAGAMLTLGPKLPPPMLRDEVANLRFAPLLGPRFLVSRRMAQRLAATHPRASHCYLGTIGVEPARQHAGVGSALLRHLLDRCDRSGLVCCLEASRLENVRLYERRGFTVQGQLQPVENGGPTIWLMQRRPGAAAPETDLS